MTEALLKTGKHTVTAITREDSTSKLPDGVQVKRVSYDEPSTIVEALRGQDALVITLGGMVPKDQQGKLIQAAADANIPWILPNEWSPDSQSEGFAQDLAMIWAGKAHARELIEKLGKSAWISVTTGFWYEWSMSIPFAYGFDFEKKSVRLYDDGNTIINTSTWPQVGRAVASLLSLKIHANGESGQSLEQFRHKHVYISSFAISQNDMLASVLRVTKTQRSDWTITQEASRDVHETARQQIAEGNMKALGGWLYGRVFYPDGDGNFEKTRGLQNDTLGLPKEDLDEYTKIAIDRAKAEAGKWAH